MLVAVLAIEGNQVSGYGHGALFFGAGLGALLLMGAVFSQPLRRSARVLAALSVIWGLAYGVRTHVWVSAQTDQSWGQARVAEEAITRRWQAATDFVVTDDAPESAVKLVKLGRSGAIGTGRWNDICTQGDYRKRNLYFVLDPATYFREINAGLFCLSTPGTEILSGGGETSREWMVVRVPGWS
jgi:hypothetical protein